jgi:hypothetical protein
MLQADEIIQQKQWQHLSAGEKAIIADLADNEQEFNLLKKMLMVSAEATDGVPAVSTPVQQHIKNTLPAIKRSPAYKYWYAAAAVLVAITVAAVFIFNKKESSGYVNSPAIKKTELIPAKKATMVPTKDTVVILVQKEVKPVELRKSLHVQKPFFPSANDSVNLQNVYAVLDASVAAYPMLIDFITEVE